MASRSTSFFAPMRAQRGKPRNPFSGLDDRGFQRGRYNDATWEAYIRSQITKMLPAGWRVLFMYYAPELAPDPVVKLVLAKPDTTTVEHDIRVPVDPKAHKWDKRTTEVLIEWARITYAS